ncbi:MAG: hypothetical protein FWH37_08155 [Candidatus Bathyarchaeota archaeon]|nr:hypothetical protein [Candidatus Termiticorpusculum sp.]
MFVFISIEKFLEQYKEANPAENIVEVKKKIIVAVADKKNGAKCNHCGQPIWAIGSAITGYPACFTCTTGEVDNSDDYEIE